MAMCISVPTSERVPKGQALHRQRFLGWRTTRTPNLANPGTSTQVAVRVLALVRAFGRGPFFDPIGAAEFRHPSTNRSGQLTVNSDTHQPVGRGN